MTTVLVRSQLIPFVRWKEITTGRGNHGKRGASMNRPINAMAAAMGGRVGSSQISGQLARLCGSGGEEEGEEGEGQRRDVGSKVRGEERARHEYQQQQQQEHNLQPPQVEVSMPGLQPGAVSGWRLEEGDVEVEKDHMLGVGLLTRVYRGRLRSKNMMPVAVKVFQLDPLSSSSDVLRQSFTREVDLLMRCQHPKILTLYGGVFEQYRFLLVTELMQTDFFHVLHRSSESPVDLKTKLVVLADAIAGLAFLHRGNIIHRDLKPHNIFVSKSGRGKLGDFGLAKLLAVDRSYSGIIGTPEWMAPETISLASPWVLSADMYSVGVILWEILTGEEPYANICENSVQVIGLKLRGIPPAPFPPTGPEDLVALVLKCLASDPITRPRATETLAILGVYLSRE